MAPQSPGVEPWGLDPTCSMPLPPRCRDPHLAWQRAGPRVLDMGLLGLCPSLTCRGQCL